MKSRDFCYWLQGFFEIQDAGANHDTTHSLTPKQVDAIRNHLAMVFKHEIDPSMGDPDHQADLDNIHGGGSGNLPFTC